MVVTSAAEAEIGAMGHPQPTTPMHTDNTTTYGILRGTCKQQGVNVIYMRLYWVRDHAQQEKIDIGRGPSAQNLGDYFTKHHTPAHHKGIR
jgi:hypothetical protein